MTCERALESVASHSGPPAEGPIYGGGLMTIEERNQYRSRLREIDSREERGHFLARHREQMQARAQARNLPIEALDES